MNEAEAQRIIRCGFNEIIAGYSPVRHNDNCLYIKHFGSRDQLEVDQVYQTHFQKIVARGVPTSEERAKQLSDSNLWTDQNERDLDLKQVEINNLKQGKKLLFIKSQIDQQQADIERAEAELLQILIEKNSLFGKTAEFFANKRVSDYCIVKSLFRDAACTKFYIEGDNVFDLDDETLEALTQVYNQAVVKFEETNIKRIALSPLFQNYYFLAKSVYEFYGRAITDLTFYQVQLATFGDYYKQILYGNESPPPQELMSDPDKLDDWIHGSGHAKKVMESVIGNNSDGEGKTFTTLVGAKQEDLKYLGLHKDEETVSLQEEVQKAGGHMTMEQIMKMHRISQ